jgi:uncharacterized phage protein (TIGR01671 family)
MIPRFRAYSKEENEMYYPHNDKNVDWTIDDETGFIAPLVNLGGGMWGMIDKYELMQSTGLKDKNGVEIFEGDIMHDEMADVYGRVRFDEGKFVYEEYEMCFDLCEVASDFSVIGNIYENPELLEVK